MSILYIDKPKGMTSFDICFRLRKVLGTRKIGHTGTLDPNATGLMIILSDKDTKANQFLVSDSKEYIAECLIGCSTDTLDIDGSIIEEKEETMPDRNDIDNVLKSFLGDSMQLPPMTSAIKVDGKKLYEYARKGEEVEIKPRSVNINELKILNYDQENRILELYIKCSKGTYIRSIAHDLGKNLGCFGHLIKLVRVKAGDFEVENSIKLEDLADVETVQKHLIYPLEKLDYQTYELNTKELELVSHGMQIFARTSLQNGIVILTNNNKLIAVAEMLNDKIKCSKVFI